MWRLLTCCIKLFTVLNGNWNLDWHLIFRGFFYRKRYLWMESILIWITTNFILASVSFWKHDRASQNEYRANYDLFDWDLTIQIFFGHCWSHENAAKSQRDLSTVKLQSQTWFRESWIWLFDYHPTDSWEMFINTKQRYGEIWGSFEC